MIIQDQKIKDIELIKKEINTDGHWVVLASQMWYSDRIALSNYKVTDDELGAFVGELFEIFSNNLKTQNININSSFLNIFSEESIKELSKEKYFPILGPNQVAGIKDLRFVEDVIRFDEQQPEKPKNYDNYGYFVFVYSPKGYFLVSNGDFAVMSAVALAKDCVKGLLEEFRRQDEYELCLKNMAEIVRRYIK